MNATLIAERERATVEPSTAEPRKFEPFVGLMRAADGDPSYCAHVVADPDRARCSAAWHGIPLYDDVR